MSIADNGIFSIEAQQIEKDIIQKNQRIFTHSYQLNKLAHKTLQKIKIHQYKIEYFKLRADAKLRANAIKRVANAISNIRQKGGHVVIDLAQIEAILKQKGNKFESNTEE